MWTRLFLPFRPVRCLQFECWWRVLVIQLWPRDWPLHWPLLSASPSWSSVTYSGMSEMSHAEQGTGYPICRHEEREHIHTHTQTLMYLIVFHCIVSLSRLRSFWRSRESIIVRIVTYYVVSYCVLSLGREILSYCVILYRIILFVSAAFILKKLRRYVPYSIISYRIALREYVSHCIVWYRIVLH